MANASKISEMRGAIESLPPHLRANIKKRHDRPYLYFRRTSELLDKSVISAARSGVGIAIEPRTSVSLSDLTNLLSVVHSLDLKGGRQGFRNWTSLESCIELEELFLAADPAEAVDFSGLPELRRAEVLGPNSTSVILNPNLQYLDARQWVAPGIRLPARLRELFVSHPPTDDLSYVVDTSELRVLLVEDADQFDLRALDRTPLLEQLRLARVRVVANAKVLATLSHLEWLHLIDVRSMPNAEVIEKLHLRWLDLPMNWILSNDARGRIGERAGWTIGRFRGVDDSTLRFSSSAETPNELIFEEWGWLAERTGLEAEYLEDYLHDVVTVAASEPPAIDVQFDPEGDIFRVLVADATLANELRHRLESA